MRLTLIPIILTIALAGVLALTAAPMEDFAWRSELLQYFPFVVIALGLMLYTYAEAYVYRRVRAALAEKSRSRRLYIALVGATVAIPLLYFALMRDRGADQFATGGGILIAGVGALLLFAIIGGRIMLVRKLLRSV